MNEKRISEWALDRIARLLGQRYGWNRDALSAPTFVREILYRIRERGVGSAAEYISLLRQEPEECERLGWRLLVHESWFFRHPGAFEHLAQIAKNRPHNHPWKLLSAGCAGGEEPYSMAISLLDAGLGPEDFIVDAIDLSDSCIRQAQEGRYSQRAFREEIGTRRKRYFLRVGTDYHVADSVRKQVHFMVANLMDLVAAGLGPYHVIFCRNVLIYLQEQAQKRLLQQLCRMLQPDGALVVAPAEGSLLHACGLVRIPYPASSTYQLPPVDAPQVVAAPAAAPIPQPPPKPSLMERAGQLADRGELREAKKLCLSLLQQKPDSEEAYFVLGVVEHARGDDGEATRYFRRVVYLKPDHYEALVYLALLADLRGDVDKARFYREWAARVYHAEEAG